MRSRYKSIVGWERYGDMLLLRMKLSQPELKRVWPGAPSVTEPEGEIRLLYDEILLFDDVRAAVDEEVTNPDHKYSGSDIRLFKQALDTLKPIAISQSAVPVP